ncbi:MAG: hypothetical protein RLZZ223_278 [Candidatus Parcubacteria bacterium]|jgi:photosystem II stability/assembly factor-like uncharacterized protein
MKVFLIPLTILIGVLIITGIVLNSYSPISIPSSSNNKNSNAKGAIWKSVDAGRNFEPKSQMESDSNLNLSKNVIKLTNGANNDILALTSRGGVFRTTNWGNSWNILLNSEMIPTTLAVSPNKTEEVYIGTIESKRARLYKTNNPRQNTSWQEIYTEPKSGTSFVDIKIDPKNDNIVYSLLSSGVLLKSYNKGLDWVLANNLKTTVIGLDIDSNNPEVVLVIGTTKVYVSKDGGFSFEESTPKLKAQAVTGAQINSFAVNPNNSQEIYLGSTGELIRSQDQGKTWENLRILTPNLSLPINNISISVSNPNFLYYNVGTVLYTSSNRGESWNTSDLSSIVKNISDILIDREKSDIIYISTN